MPPADAKSSMRGADVGTSPTSADLAGYTAEQRALYEPFVIRIHNLDASTKTSARLQAERIVEKLPPIRLPPHKFRAGDQGGHVPLHRLVIASVDHNRNASSASISFPAVGYLDGTIDDRSLAYVLRELSRTHTCEYAAAPGNDRSTIMSFILAHDPRPPRPTNTPNPQQTFSTPDLARMTPAGAVALIANKLTALGAKPSATWGVRQATDPVGRVVYRGSCAYPDPKLCRKIIDQELFHFVQWGLKVDFTAPRYIAPTYPTTMALYIGSDLAVYELDWYARMFNSIAADYNNKRPAPLTGAWVFNVQFVMDRRFVRFNPSDPLLGKFMSERQINDFFPQRVWDLNQNSTNFVHKELIRARDQRALDLGLLPKSRKRRADDSPPRPPFNHGLKFTSGPSLVFASSVPRALAPAPYIGTPTAGAVIGSDIMTGLNASTEEDASKRARTIRTPERRAV